MLLQHKYILFMSMHVFLVYNRFCIANRFQLVNCTMDQPSNYCSHWTPDTYSNFTDGDNSTQLQILRSYIPFLSDGGCLESISMSLQTLYQPNTTNVGQGHCENCVLQISNKTARQRAFLFLRNISTGPHSTSTTIKRACKKELPPKLIVDYLCCCPATTADKGDGIELAKHVKGITL